MITQFEEQHQRLYGIHSPGQAFELVVVRARAVGEQRAPELPPLETRDGPMPDDLLTTLANPLDRWALVERETLCAGDRLEGPLIVTEYSSTTLVPTGWTATVDPQGHMILRKGDAS